MHWNSVTEISCRNSAAISLPTGKTEPARPRETALNRAAAERLVQAETLFAMLQPAAYPTDAFDQAWRNVVLYDEHTWGAHCSITEPESDFTKAQWAIKQKFALDADSQSRELLEQATAARQDNAKQIAALDVLNTCSWPRTDLVRVPANTPVVGDVVKDAEGKIVPSQRLASGELAFLAADIPPLAAKRFTFHTQTAQPTLQHTASVSPDGLTLGNDQITVTLDPRTGAIAKLIWNNHNFAQTSDSKSPAINDYFYVAGRKPDHPQQALAPKITVQDRGPLVTSLLVSSDAPGCNSLQRQISLIAGLDRLDIVNVVDKRNIYDQEAVHFAFPLHVPDGVIRMDIPWAVAEVETDQLPGACKNYFTVQRWADVANDQIGITLATVDAPLLEVGNITCDPVAVGWIKQLEPTQTLYSYVMNNYWETNYKAGQEGPTTFRYSLRPHHTYDSLSAEQFGIEQSQPLVAVSVDLQSKPIALPLQVTGEGVLLTCVKPSNDRAGIVLRLFNATPSATRAHVTWRDPGNAQIQICDLAETVSRCGTRLDRTESVAVHHAARAANWCAKVATQPYGRLPAAPRRWSHN